MSKGIIAVDVDLTVADSDISHWDWLQRQCLSFDTEMPAVDDISYDLGSYFDLPSRVDSMSFWREESLYDESPQFGFRPIMPIKGSIDALRILSNGGWEIVFVSHVKGNHHKSKVEWLKRHFPFMSGFVATKEKKYVDCDILIDDRNLHLNSSNAQHKIRFETHYDQDIKLNQSHLSLITDDWFKILYEISRLESSITNRRSK
jgi:5'(3')-deoxyribonucleotidase